MCTICSAFRPYTPDCDYEGLAQTSSSATTSATSSAPIASLDEMADYLTDGFWEDLGVVGHGYDTSSSNQITVNITGLTADGQQLARWAFEAWESVADIDFVEVSDADAQIVINDNDPGAVTGYMAIEDVVESSTINIGPDWLEVFGTQLGSYAFQSYMHEIGHTLGLGHQGNYNNDASYGTTELFANDSWQLSVMSYFDQQQNTMVDDTRAETVTPMMVDIIAIQSIYGAPGTDSLTAGDTTYGKDHTLGDSWMGQLTDAALGTGSAEVWDGTPFSLTVYDHSGYDVIDFSTDTEDQIVDLNGEGISNVFGAEGTMAIARDTVIEEYRAGKGDDKVIGNDADNVILGGGGDDDMDGGDGKDKLNGGGGNDTLIGGGDNDILNGGTGDDYMHGGNKKDVLSGGDGNDEMKGGGARDILNGDAGDDNMGGGGGTDDVFGGDGNDRVSGGNGTDTLTGDNGDDVLKGGGGNDNLAGGDGNDVLAGGNGDDVLTDTSGDDNMNGGRGNDTLIGGTGDDRLKGGSGSDVFVFSTGDGSDVIKDFDATDDAEVLDLSAVTAITSFADLTDPSSNHIRQDGNDVVITDGAGLEIELRNVDLSDLDANDFIF